jgi:hypothetical protein
LSSPGFSSFRSLMDLWDLSLAEEELESKIKALVEGGEYVMFLKKDGDVYGVPEEGRVVYARMKHPDEDSKGWVDEATFIGMNLTKMVQGHPSQSIFAKKDFGQIKVISSEKAIARLAKQSQQKPDEEPGTDIMVIKQPEETQ